MIRLMVLYNLPEGESEDSFLEWRLSEHQENNESMPGVIRTDFARITDSWPTDSLPQFTFQTTAEWPDRASFDAGFYRDDVQEAMQINLKRLGEYSFVVSEVLTSSEQ